MELLPPRNDMSAKLESLTQDLSPLRNFVCPPMQQQGPLLENLECRQLGRLVLFERVLQWEPVQCSGRDQAPVILGDLDLQPLVNELAATCTAGQGDESKCIRARFRQHDHVQPGDLLGVWIGRIDADWALEEPFEAA
jgi:hypothetical protein